MNVEESLTVCILRLKYQEVSKKVLLFLRYKIKVVMPVFCFLEQKSLFYSHCCSPVVFLFITQKPGTRRDRDGKVPHSDNFHLVKLAASFVLRIINQRVENQNQLFLTKEFILFDFLYLKGQTLEATINYWEYPVS